MSYILIVYTVSYHKQAIKALQKMPREAATKIRAELLVIAQSPYTYAGDFKPLQGREGWRLRCGKYRVLCRINDDELLILVVDAGPRRHLQMNVQIISHNGTPEYAVIPYEEFEHLLESAEMLDDIRTFDAAVQRLASGEEELFPDSLVERLLSDEHPLKVWREYRGLTLAALASACNVTTSALSQIEKGKREPSVALLKRLALALRCDMDDLTPSVP